MTSMAGRMSCTSSGDGSLMDATFQGMIIINFPSRVGVFVAQFCSSESKSSTQSKVAELEQEAVSMSGFLNSNLFLLKQRYIQMLYNWNRKQRIVLQREKICNGYFFQKKSVLVKIGSFI